jgi:glycosyltransferase involved in cell wall biosynthesis
MRIVHVIIANFYKEGYGYQENILPAKHKELGLETYVVTTNDQYPLGRHYINKDGIDVTCLEVNDSFFSKKRYLCLFVNKTVGLFSYLDGIKPDIIFLHGLQAIDSLIVYRWCKKKPKVKLYVDQHADYYNTPITKFSTRLYHKVVFGYIAKKLSKYAVKFWGVTPWRVDYLQKVYGLAPEKTDLLVMGGDENLIDWKNRQQVRAEIREKCNIPKEAFLLVTGGKIDQAKNIHLLCEAAFSLKDKNVYLIVFGSLLDDMKNYSKSLYHKNVRYIGWIDSRDVYPYFLASDLAVFPGTHSVLWEQALASGIPGLFKDWDGGFNHIDCGGNALLIKDISIDTLVKEIDLIVEDTAKYRAMRDAAENTARKEFAYMEIAKRSIGI